MCTMYLISIGDKRKRIGIGAAHGKGFAVSLLGIAIAMHADHMIRYHLIHIAVDDVQHDE